MADAKAEEEWKQAVKKLAEEPEDKEFDDAPKDAKHNVKLDSDEEKLLTEAVVATIQRQQPELCKNDPEVQFLAVCYLRFRNYAVIDAVARLTRFLEFRAKYGLQRQTTLNPTLKGMLLDGTRVLLPGTDKEGRALSVTYLKNNRPHDPKLMMELMHWIIMRTVRRGPDIQKKGVTVIFDLEGASFKNFDPTQMKEMKPALFKCFPMRMANCFIVNPNTIADVIVPIFKHFNTEKMGARIHIVKDLAEIHAVVDKSQLPPNLGGTLNFDFKAWVEEVNK